MAGSRLSFPLKPLSELIHRERVRESKRERGGGSRPATSTNLIGLSMTYLEGAEGVIWCLLHRHNQEEGALYLVRQLFSVFMCVLGGGKVI